MKKILIALFICFPFFSISQKTYHITGISKSYIGLAGIGKTDMLITVDDSTFTSIYKKTKTVYNIIKKVDSNYFKISDGLKDYVIRISDQKYRKYSGSIIQETDKGDMIFYYE